MESSRVSARVERTANGTNCRLMIKTGGKVLGKHVQNILDQYGAIEEPDGTIYCHGDSFAMLSLACLVRDSLF